MQQPYVLVVESEPDLSRRIVDALREARYEIASEAEIGWAKRSVAARRPDAVVLDTALFDGSGFALAKDLRADPATASVPLLFVARRHRGASHRAEALRRFAALDYLQAPLDVAKLLVALLENVPPVAGAPQGGQAPAPIAADDAQKREAREVERSAKGIAGDAELKGSLKRTAFARLLQTLYARKADGQLLLLRGQTKKIVQFARGYPVAVRSNVLSECLGQILVERKLITNAALTESLQRMKAEKKQQGAILVEMGALSPHNLANALVAQTEAKLFDLFSWRDGQFSFVESPAAGGSSKPVDRPIDRSAASLILEGIRRHYDGARLDAVLADYVGKYVALSPDPALRLQEMTDDPAELSFIYGIDGQSRLEALLDTGALPRDKARLLLAALSEARMIEPAATAPRRVTELVRPAPRAPAPETDMAVRTRLATLLDAIVDQDHFQALGLAPDASRDDVEAAYDRLAREYHADRFRGRPEDVRRIAQEIFARLGAAYEVLRDGHKRRAYAAKVGGTPLLERDPNAGSESVVGPNPIAHEMYKAGVEALRRRRYQEAVEAFRQAARLVPEHASYRAALGWALFREAPAEARASRAAVNELRRAIQIDPANHKAHVYLGHVYAQTGRPELAIDEFETVQRLKPGAADVAEELRRLRGVS